MTTVQDLVDFYLTTDEYAKLRVNSKEAYHTAIYKSPQWLTEDVDLLDLPYKLEVFKKRWKRAYSRNTSNFMVAVFKRIWKINFNYGKIKHNAFIGVTAEGTRVRKTLWTKAEVAQIQLDAVELGFPSFALFIHMAYELCQRPSDLISAKMAQLRTKNIGTDDTPIMQTRIKITQIKTGAKVDIAISDNLLEHIYARKPFTNFILNYELTKVRYTQANATDIFKRIRDATGNYKHLQLRDLRRTGLTELGEAGCTEDEIMSVSGHKSREMVSRYVIRTPKMTDNATAKRVAYLQQNKT